ncbi:MAG: NAD(P)-dependent oxidoreductase [Candidatus Omnitrophica bacterium]|nr:NAD(P)-dependent oxidoreductase [Candidatus Omnitrophota bacterium]
MNTSHFRAKTFLLTGATGFIGSCLLRRLAVFGIKPHIIIRPDARLWRIRDILSDVKCHILDITDAKAVKATLKRVRPDIIYHLAANGAYSSQNDPERIVRTNIVGGWNLLSSACEFGSELFVNTGTSSEYGFKTGPMNESDALQPVSYYATTKCAMTWLSAQASRQNQSAVVTLRPFSVYGPYEEPSRLVPKLMEAFHRAQAIDLVNSKTVHDFIYIDDLLEAYLNIEALKRNSGKVFNLGTGKQTTIKKIVTVVQKVTGKSADLRWGAMPSRSWDALHWVADVSQAREFLGWSAKTSLEEGLRKTWRWYCKHHQIYLKTGRLAA